MRLRDVAGVLAGVLMSGCGDDLPPQPEPTPSIASVRLLFTAPTAEMRLGVGLAPECEAAVGGLQLPLNVDATLSAVFLDDAGEPDPAANNAATHRLSGDGDVDPELSVGSIAFTRTGAQTGTLRGTAPVSGTITLSLVHVASGRVDWGPCAIPVTVLAPEAAPPAWTPATASPVSSGSHFQDASFVSPTRGWVVGAPGEVYLTNDGGASWEQRYAIPSNSSLSFFRSTAFISDTKGFIGDLNRFNNPEPLRSLWETTDAGATWTNISSRITGAPVTGVCGMWVIDATTVVGVGRWNGPATFVKTTDAGATWQGVSLAPMLTGAVDVYFFDAMNGIIAGGRGVGNLPVEQLASVVVVLGTTDGGATWTPRFTGSFTGAWSWKISFPTPEIGYIATQGPGSGATVLKTVDGGQSWREITIRSGPSGGLWGAGFTSARVGWVGADNGVWETRDGGLTWSQTSWGTDGSINRFRILPSGNAFAIGKQVYRLAP